MDIILWPPKASNETLIYGLDWDDALQGDTVSSAAWTIPDGLIASGEAVSGDFTTLMLAGGEDGKLYTIHCEVTTASGQVIVQTVQIQIG